MLVEKSRAEAIKAFLNGKQVRVITEFDGGSMAIELIEEILPEEDTRYLVDVPAVEDSGFLQAVEDMAHGSDRDAMDEDKNGISAQAAKIAKELKYSVEGEVLPPPPHGAGDRTTSGRKIKKGISPGAVG